MWPFLASEVEVRDGQMVRLGERGGVDHEPVGRRVKYDMYKERAWREGTEMVVGGEVTGPRYPIILEVSTVVGIIQPSRHT
jgi:hypothetical protein